MVSSSSVASNTEDFNQISVNYMSRMDDLSSSWAGISHDSLLNQCSQFYAEMQQVTNQLSAFLEAVAHFEAYEEIKQTYHLNVDNYNNQVRFSNNQAAINDYMGAIGEGEQKLRECATLIQDALARAASFKLSSSYSHGVAGDGAAVNTATEAGVFVPDMTGETYGTIVSGVSGKEHTIYNQYKEGWRKDCNRAAASSIASGYENYDGEAIEKAKESPDGLGYDSDVTKAYFSNFGLNATVNTVDGSYDSVRDDIISNLTSGNQVMFDLKSKNVVGESGQRWSFQRHWVSALDIKKTGDGPNDYAIYISDSAHGGSAADHGLGAGWYSINEFCGEEIMSFTTIGPSQ